jgi:hypothetical protein
VRQLLAFSRRQTLRPQVLQLGDVLSDLQMQYRIEANKIVRNGAWIMRSMGAEPAFGVTLRQNGGRTIVSSLPPPTGKRSGWQRV